MKINQTITNLAVSSFNSELVSTKSTNYDYKQKLYKELTSRSINDKLISEIYKKLLQELISRFSSLVYRDDQDNIKKIPCWHGSSERVISKLKQESNIILPVVSIVRDVDKVDSSRRRHEGLLVFEKYFDRVKNRAVRVASLAPTPTIISYTLNVWTKYYEDMDHICEQVRRSFNPHILVPTKYNIEAAAYLNEESSDIDISVADGKDRLVRRSFSMSVETYIPNPKFLVTHTGVIEEFNAEIHFPL